MVASKVGSPVRGSSFFDREDEQRDLWETLKGDSVLLLAPRRVGKTSLLWKLEDTATERGWHAAYVSVAGAQIEETFLARVVKGARSLPLAKKALDLLGRGPLRSLVERVERVEAAGLGIELTAKAQVPWSTGGEALLEALEQSPQPLVLMLDEVPVFVLALLRQDPTGARARTFLTWLRELRQLGDRSDKIRWILAGSIGLDTVAARLGVGDTVNDLYRFPLGPLSAENADRLLVLRGEQEVPTLSPEVRRHLCARVGWLIPYYLQLLDRELRRLCRQLSAAPTIEHVDAVIEDLTSPAKKGYFDSWRQRLHDELGRPDSEHAIALLNAICRAPEGASLMVLSQVLGRKIRGARERDEQLGYLLDVLDNDGYIAQRDHQPCFRSPLLRHYWERRVLPP